MLSLLDINGKTIHLVSRLPPSQLSGTNESLQIRVVPDFAQQDDSIAGSEADDTIVPSSGKHIKRNRSLWALFTFILCTGNQEIGCSKQQKKSVHSKFFCF